MDSQDYLNQISAEARPAKNNTGLMKIVTSKYFMWGMIALAALIVMMIFGSIMGSNKKPGLEVECYTLNLHLSSNVELIDTYQPNVKSSKLRSLSASLKGVFSNTSSQLTNYME